MSEHLDVVVVGAGLSGIGAGYHLRTRFPDKTFAILEARERIGGTWDLFRYPGVRSDSDIFTLAYPFEPWREEESLVSGESIRRYVEHTASNHGLTEHLRLQQRVVAADWSSEQQHWRLTVRATDGSEQESTLTCSFLYGCTGYYDYEHPYAAPIPGLDDFGGQVVHPQFWPEDLDWSGKRVVVIGSGATAVTIVPSMAEQAEHVTMLQRTPTWILPVPRVDALANALRERLPADVAHRVVRAKNIAMMTGIYQFCRRFPGAARKVLLSGAQKGVGDAFDPADFTPPYDPWDQRLCLIPNGDLFKAVRRGRASVVTDRIAGFDDSGVLLASGRHLPADVVVTATGLQLQLFGGLVPSVDGEPVDLSQQMVWRGAMLTSMPNFAFCIGYTNASWTLRADLSHRLVCKVLAHLDDRGLGAVVPSRDPGLEPRPLLDLASGYVRRSLAELPKQGDRGVWRVRQNYLLDVAATLRTDLDATLEAVPPTRVAPADERRMVPVD